jgi:membrane protein
MGLRRARQGADWGRQKYAGSSAEYLWNRLNALDFINLGMLFAATMLLCFIPFLIVGDALAGRSTVHTLARHAGLNEEAAADFGHLIAPSATTYNAVVGTASIVFFVLGGIAAATALQQLYERVFDLSSRGLRDVWRRLIWLGWLMGTGLLSGWAGPPIRHALGPVLLGIAAVAWFTAFWWVTLWILVGGRISWRRLFPCACATGVFYAGMLLVFSFFFSDMVTSEYKEYGPIGLVFALMTFLITIGVVIILGAVVGLVWQERGLSFAAAFRKLRRAR